MLKNIQSFVTSFAVLLCFVVYPIHAYNKTREIIPYWDNTNSYAYNFTATDTQTISTYPTVNYVMSEPTKDIRCPNIAYDSMNGVEENYTFPIPSPLTNAGNDRMQMINYTYDAHGNIKNLSGSNTQTSKYYYNNTNQLICDNDTCLNKTIITILEIFAS